MRRRHWTGIIASLGILAAGTGLAQAQGMFGAGHHGPGSDPGRMVERLKRHLDLDETQQAQVDNVLEAAWPEYEALRDRAEANRIALRELDWSNAEDSARINDLAAESGQIVTDGVLLMARVRAEIRNLLTAEQIAELEATAETWHARRADRRGRRHR